MSQLKSLWFWITNPSDILTAFPNNVRVIFNVPWHTLQSIPNPHYLFNHVSGIFVKNNNVTLFQTLMEQNYCFAKTGIATCNLLDITAENSNNLQMLHYSQLPIESGVDNRWKSALCQKKEGWCRTDARGAWHCRHFGSSSHYCSKSISCNLRDAANQEPTLVETASVHYLLSRR